MLTAFVDRITGEPINTVTEWAKYFSSGVWEIVMVKWNGINDNMQLVNSPAWTLSALLIVGALIWTLMYYYKAHFLHIIMPLSLVIGFGYWMQIPSANVELWIGFTTFGTFRTWLVMCLSYYCIPLSQRLAKSPFNRTGKLLLTAAEIMCHFFSLLGIFFTEQRYAQWLVMVAFMCSISIALSGHSYLEDLLSRGKLVDILGELSMSVYLVHKAVILIFKNVADISKWNYIQIIPMIIVIFILAAIHLNLTRAFSVTIQSIREKIKGLIFIR